MQKQSRSLKVTHKWDYEDDGSAFFTFYEDGTYFKSWAPDDEVLWRLHNGVLQFKEIDIWESFFEENEEIEEITEVITQWLFELNFHDALDEVLK